jgi:hypothetical protein
MSPAGLFVHVIAAAWNVQAFVNVFAKESVTVMVAVPVAPRAGPAVHVGVLVHPLEALTPESIQLYVYDAVPAQLPTDKFVVPLEFVAAGFALQVNVPPPPE